MDDYYERLNQAFANWNGGEPSLDDRVAALESEILQKQDILTFDTEPVENSENPVTSGGLFSQFERYATKTALYEKVDISNFTSDQDRQDALEAEDRAALIELVDGGAKNLLRIATSSQVVGGVTFTINSDGSITANGTKTNNDWFYLSTGNSLAAGTYVLSSGLAPQSDMNIRLLITTADSLGSAIMSAEGTRQVHTKQLTSDYTGLYYAIRISAGTTVDNVVFKPMLCTAADYAISSAFVPYAPSNRELYEMILALQSGS